MFNDEIKKIDFKKRYQSALTFQMCDFGYQTESIIHKKTRNSIPNKASYIKKLETLFPINQILNYKIEYKTIT